MLHLLPAQAPCRRAWLVIFCCVATGVARAEPGPTFDVGPSSVTDLGAMSLQDLMNVEVTSVSRQKQKVSDAAAAVTVIGQDDIRRSHLDSVPELLRLVPGMYVGQLNANTWAIGSRGFADVFANKELVVVDGRTVYTPLFSGVFWDLQETMVSDLDRIEAIRGPGATLWGSNAVNGVINVTSKSAKETQGWLFDGTYESVDQRGAIRYGGKLDDNTYYRVWGQFHATDDYPAPGDGDMDGVDGRGHASHDGWDSLSSGFRLDRFSGADDTFTVIGNAISIREGKTTQVLLTQAPYTQNLPLTSTDDDFNLLGRWTHVIDDHSDFSIQAYYDHLDHAVVQNKYALDTADIDFQHRFPIGQRQEVIWGAGYRFMADGFTPGPRVFIQPSHRDDYIANAFVQDDVTVVKDRLHLIVGTKLEENSFSGFEAQPSARVLWTPSERQTVWAAVSRAVRTPSRYEQDATVQATSTPVPPTGIAALSITQPSPGFQSESEVAYELGHRIQATKSLSFDTALYFNQYDKLRSFDFGNPTLVGTAMPPFLSVPVTFGNNLTANAYGGEVAVNWRVTDHWRLSGSYSLCVIDARQRHPGTDPTGVTQLEGTTPRNQAQVHSYVDLSRHWAFDASAYYAESMPYLKVPSNLRVDLALTWAPKDNLSVTFGVQNLLDRWHPEFGGITSDIQRTEVPRTVFAQLVYRF